MENRPWVCKITVSMLQSCLRFAATAGLMLTSNTVERSQWLPVPRSLEHPHCQREVGNGSQNISYVPVAISNRKSQHREVYPRYHTLGSALAPPGTSTYILLVYVIHPVKFTGNFIKGKFQNHSMTDTKLTLGAWSNDALQCLFGVEAVSACCLVLVSASLPTSNTEIVTQRG